MDSYIQIAWRDRGFIDDFVNNGCYVLADERLFARQHFVEDNAQAEQIRTPIQRASFYLLRRHVIGRTQDLPGVSDLPAGFGDAEIHDLYRAVRGDHDVGRLYIAMNNSV